MEQEDVLIVPNPRGTPAPTVTTIVKECTEVGETLQLFFGESFCNLLSKMDVLNTSDFVVGVGDAQFVEDPVDTFLDTVCLDHPPDDSLDYSRMSGTGVANYVSGGMSRRNSSFPVGCLIRLHFCKISKTHSTCQRIDHTMQWRQVVGYEPSKGLWSRIIRHVVVRSSARRVTRDEQRVQYLEKVLQQAKLSRAPLIAVTIE